MSFDPTKPLLPKMAVEKENEALKGLYWECERYLQKWGAYTYTTEDAPTDAIVAVLTLQNELVARRAYILGLLHQEELPF